MAEHLLAISIGPIQDFIVAARRTRDLWFGSHVLSEISKAAAVAVGVENLIFPPRSCAVDPDSHVANIILAQLPDGLDPKTAGAGARAAAIARWNVFADEAYALAKDYIDEDLWRAQIGDVVEFYAAWQPLGSKEEYRNARRRVMRLLAGRKMCRDFVKAEGRAKRPKSSLDGARESVWKTGESTEQLNRTLERRLRLADGEQLDAIGVVKRLGGGLKPYPSVSRIAADPWLRGLEKAAPARLQRLSELCRSLTGKGMAEVRMRQFAHFPYEGTAVYRTRHAFLAKETGWPKEDFAQLTKEVERLERDFGVPEPYLAVIVADGDRMGGAISGMESAGEHRAFSERLAAFAGAAKEIVEKDHHGALVYSGGDDVMALVPVDQCLECSRRLHDEFDKVMPSGAKERPTLSVGIAIGHCMEPLEDLLGYARAAERAAKGPERDGLAVHLHSRGGAPVRVAARWPNEPEKELQSLVRMHRANQIPDKAGYDLRELSRIYENWPAEAAAAIEQDVVRLIKRKRVKDPETSWKALFSGMKDAAAVRLTAEKIILARKLASIEAQAMGDRKETRAEAVA